MNRSFLSITRFAVILMVLGGFIVSRSINAQNDPHLTQEELLNDYSKQVREIAQLLTDKAVDHIDGGWKWQKFMNIDDSLVRYSHYYPGLFYGAAGVGSFFLNMFDTFNDNQYLQVAEKAGQYILSQAITNGTTYKVIFGEEDNQSILWYRAENSITAYSGLKYGNAGISSYLLDLFERTGNETYLNYAEWSLQTLLRVVLDSYEGMTWSYSFDSTPLWDIMYGTGGKGLAFLKAYGVTGNETYLEIAEEISNSILTKSEVSEDTNEGVRNIYFTTDPLYKFYFTGLMNGQAGMGMYFLKLYEVTQDTNLLRYARQFGNYLIQVGKEVWDYGGSDLLTQNPNSEGTYLGLSAGSAGIGLFFLKLYQETEEVKYLEPAVRVHQLLEKESQGKKDGHTYWYVQKKGSDENSIHTGLSTGVAGIGLFYSELFNMFGLPEVLETLAGIDSYLTWADSRYNFIPHNVTNHEELLFEDSSLFEGLAGIGWYYLSTIRALNQSSSMYEQSVFEDVDVSSHSFLGLSAIMTLSVIVILQKKLRSN